MYKQFCEAATRFLRDIDLPAPHAQYPRLHENVDLLLHLLDTQRMVDNPPDKNYFAIADWIVTIVADLAVWNIAVDVTGLSNLLLILHNFGPYTPSVLKIFFPDHDAPSIHMLHPHRLAGNGRSWLPQRLADGHREHLVRMYQSRHKQHREELASVTQARDELLQRTNWGETEQETQEAALRYAEEVKVLNERCRRSRKGLDECKHALEDLDEVVGAV